MPVYNFVLEKGNASQLEVNRSALILVMQGVNDELNKELQKPHVKAAMATINWGVGKASKGIVKELKINWYFNWVNKEKTIGSLSCGFSYPIDSLPIANLKKINWDGLMRMIKNNVKGLKVYKNQSGVDLELV
jgi:hypothetical protein